MFVLAYTAVHDGVADAEVTRVEVARRADVGRSGYEKIVGTIHFAVDPKDPRNQVVVDLDKLELTADGNIRVPATDEDAFSAYPQYEEKNFQTYQGDLCTVL